MRILTTELKVGLLLLGGFGIIVYSSVLVTGWQPGQGDTYRVDVYMDNVAGLLIGSPAQVAGIKIGQVRTIELVQGRAKIGLEILRRYKIYADSSATLKSLGILGDKYIDIRPGTSTQVILQDGDTIRFVIPGSDLDSLVDTASVILRDVQSVTGSLRETLGGESGRRKLQILIDSLVEASQNLNEITDATNRRIDGIMGNLAHFAAGLDRLIAENEVPLGNTVSNLEQATAGLRRVITDNEVGLQSTIASLGRFAGNLERISTENEAGIKSTIDNLAAFSGELQAITAQNREALGQIVADLGTFSESLAVDGPEITGSIRAILDENRTALKSSIDNLDLSLGNLAQLSGDLRDVTRDNRDELGHIIVNLDILTTDLAMRGPSITENLDGILEENRTLLHSSVTNLDRSFVKLDSTLAILDRVTGRIDRGEGSLGKLINDETTVDELNSALAGINQFLTEVNRLRIDVGGHTEYLTGQGEFKSYLNLKLQPLKNRYYLIQLIDNPRGNVTERTIQSKTTGTDPANNVTTEIETEDELQLSLLVAQRYFDTVLKGGLMENTFGLGVEQLFGRDDQYTIGLDVWDFGNEFGTHAKLTAYWRFFSNAFVLVGYDDFLSKNREFRDAFFGVGVMFNEDSLKPLFSSLPLASAAGSSN
ncbi:MAG: MlaD family protein [SAR324 cluster bacterium]|nr:MlaD family protein [SAR324 cluster bacterium]